MIDKFPLVSIIVPVYGTETYLPACIESLCKQSYSKIQIILVDDQSPDRCPEICDDYAKKDSRINVIHQENKGVSGARNTGVRYATGEYVMFVDSDDELLPNAVELLVMDAIKYKADIVSSNIKTVDNKGRVVDVQEDGSYKFFQEDEPLLLLLDEDPSSYSACAKLFKTDFVKDIQFEEGKHMGEDGFYMFCCYIQNPRPRFVQHNIAVYQYNIRSGSGSRSKFSDKTLSILYFFEKKKAYVTENLPQYIENLYQAEACLYLRLLDILCSTNEKKYKPLQKQCIKKVRTLGAYYRPINAHHKMLVRIVSCGLYGVYRLLVRIKYYR